MRGPCTNRKFEIIRQGLESMWGAPSGDAPAVAAPAIPARSRSCSTCAT